MHLGNMFGDSLEDESGICFIKTDNLLKRKKTSFTFSLETKFKLTGLSSGLKHCHALKLLKLQKKNLLQSVILATIVFFNYSALIHSIFFPLTKLLDQNILFQLSRWVVCSLQSKSLRPFLVFPKLNKTLPLYLPTNEHSVTSKFRKGTVKRSKSLQKPNIFTDSLFGERQTNRKLHRTNWSPRCVIRGSINCII